MEHSLFVIRMKAQCFNVSATVEVYGIYKIANYDFLHYDILGAVVKMKLTMKLNGKFQKTLATLMVSTS